MGLIKAARQESLEGFIRGRWTLFAVPIGSYDKGFYRLGLITHYNLCPMAFGLTSHKILVWPEHPQRLATIREISTLANCLVWLMRRAPKQLFKRSLWGSPLWRSAFPTLIGSHWSPATLNYQKHPAAVVTKRPKLDCYSEAVYVMADLSHRFPSIKRLEQLCFGVKHFKSKAAGDYFILSIEINGLDLTVRL